MKTLIKILAAVGVMTLFGCSKIIYTNDQVLSQYKTKDDVLKQFGPPTEKITDTVEQWLYRYQKVSKQRSEPTGYMEVKNASTKDVEAFTFYGRFVIFSFDQKGNVVQWYTKDVDFTQKTFSPGRTIGLVAGSIGAAVIVAVIIASSMSFKFDLSQ
jgi:hypothetical protein